MALPLWAAGAAAIAAQLEQGQAESALQASEGWLETHPEDLEVRFLRARALAELGRAQAAIEAFAALARAQPRRPGPANNLAVLYARQGKYEQARRWLEAAMETHPAYAIAHRNLGDVYTALAAVAYSKALNPDGAPQALGVQLELVPRLYPLVGTDGAAAPTAITSASANAGSPAITSEPRIVAAPAPVPEPAAPPADAGAADPEVVAQATPVILTAVASWAEAWSAQDVDAYLGTYAASFDPEGDLSLALWRAQRRERVAAPAYIEIKVLDPVVTMPGPDRAQVIFEQVYRSDTYHDRVRKTLLMVRTPQGWQIRRETETLL